MGWFFLVFYGNICKFHQYRTKTVVVKVLHTHRLLHKQIKLCKHSVLALKNVMYCVTQDGVAGCVVKCRQLSYVNIVDTQIYKQRMLVITSEYIIEIFITPRIPQKIYYMCFCNNQLCDDILCLNISVDYTVNYISYITVCSCKVKVVIWSGSLMIKGVIVELADYENGFKKLWRRSSKKTRLNMNAPGIRMPSRFIFTGKFKWLVSVESIV